MIEFFPAIPFFGWCVMAKNSYKFWKMIENWGAKGVGGNHHKGYRWLTRTFIPALLRAENDTLSPHQKMCLADAYYVLGDIHDFNNAPKAAIAAYSKSIEILPSCGAWREMGGMLANMDGHQVKAVQCLEMALSIDPDDEYATVDLEYLKSDFSEPLYHEHDPYWQVRELLAVSELDDALDLLFGDDSLVGMMHRARVLGALGNVQGYMTELNKVKLKNCRFELEYGDWFYLPDDLYDTADYWKLMIEISLLLDPGVSLSDSSFSDHYSNLLQGKSTELLMFQFHYYRCTRNYSEIRRLNEAYPKWRMPAKALKGAESVP